MRPSDLLRLNFGHGRSRFYVDLPSLAPSVTKRDEAPKEEPNPLSLVLPTPIPIAVEAAAGSARSMEIKGSDGSKIQIRAEDLIDLGIIGQDGFGLVNKMKDRESGRIMAVKVLYRMAV